MQIRDSLRWSKMREKGDELTAAAPMMPSASPKLDFLRAFAVLLVLYSHVDQAQGVSWLQLSSLAPIGRLGVLLFFVHTSLVLMFSLERHVKLYGHRRLYSTFMLRRIFRIYPLSMFIVLAIVIFEIPGRHIEVNSVTYNGTDSVGFIADMLLVQNVVISNEGANALLGPLWSLPLEIQMYLLLPMLFIFFRPIRNLPALLTLWGLSAGLAIGSYLAMQVFGMTIASFSWGTIILPKILIFVPCFLAGIVAYSLWTQTRVSIPFRALPGMLVAIVLLYIAVFNAPGGEHTIDVLGMVVCLALGLLLPRLMEPTDARLEIVCATIAKYSYGIYLVHVPCIWLGFDVLADQNLFVQWIIFISATAFFSFSVYHLVEKPFIEFGARLGKKWVMGQGISAPSIRIWPRRLKSPVVTAKTIGMESGTDSRN
jgi:peptidoglycan/LPS O-acetylase OafA/YrhL